MGVVRGHPSHIQFSLSTKKSPLPPSLKYRRLRHRRRTRHCHHLLLDVAQPASLHQDLATGGARGADPPTMAPICHLRLPAVPELLRLEVSDGGGMGLAEGEEGVGGGCWEWRGGRRLRLSGRTRREARWRLAWVRREAAATAGEGEEGGCSDGNRRRHPSRSM